MQSHTNSDFVDSSFKNTTFGVAILPLNGAEPPELVLENVLMDTTSITVGIVGGGQTYLEGTVQGESKRIKSWALGTRYGSRHGKPEVTHGHVNPAPSKPSNLVDKDGKYFVRSKPDYSGVKADQWVVVTDHDVQNDGTGDQTAAINKVLSPVPRGQRYVYFPAGIYQVMGTITIPPGTVMVGSGWSDIRATGSYFENPKDPKPVVRVGSPGSKGMVEISDMLFTVKGATAGAILMEWNIQQIFQGSAAMWDSHFRIGGAVGTDLNLAKCPQSGGLQEKCMAASLLLHMTVQSSGYLENVWLWTADQ